MPKDNFDPRSRIFIQNGHVDRRRGGTKIPPKNYPRNRKNATSLAHHVFLSQMDMGAKAISLKSTNWVLGGLPNDTFSVFGPQMAPGPPQRTPQTSQTIIFHDLSAPQAPQTMILMAQARWRVGPKAIGYIYIYIPYNIRRLATG